MYDYGKITKKCRNRNIEQQIEKAQTKVIRSKSAYEAAVDALQKP